jgi:hypothetical protein
MSEWSKMKWVGVASSCVATSGCSSGDDAPWAIILILIGLLGVAFARALARVGESTGSRKSGK